MIEQLVGQFMQSGAGTDVISQLTSKGLDAGQAKGAIAATAEGVMEQMGGSAGGLGAMLGGAGLGGMSGDLAGGAGAGALGGLIQPVSNFVAAKTGLAPAMATMVVTVALPKVLELIQGKLGSADSGASATGGLGAIGGKLGGLF